MCQLPACIMNFGSSNCPFFSTGILVDPGDLGDPAVWLYTNLVLLGIPHTSSTMTFLQRILTLARSPNMQAFTDLSTHTV